MDEARFTRAVAAIDTANADDPHTLVVGGVERPKELTHAQMATKWVRRLRPDADEALLLAARAHHLRRWAVPRSEYPDGRSGYLRWKRDLQARHAADVARILEAEGYGADLIDRVTAIVRKRGLGRDPDVQALGDALCLVFIETQFSELAARLYPDKMVDVVRKTLAKMSDEAKAHALAMDLSPADRTVVERALA